MLLAMLFLIEIVYTLHECNKMYDKDDKDGFIGYTLINPTKVSDNLKSRAESSESI